MVASIAMKHKQFKSDSVICLHTVKHLNISIWPIDETLTGRRGPGSNDNEEVHHIPQNSRTEASPTVI